MLKSTLLSQHLVTVVQQFNEIQNVKFHSFRFLSSRNIKTTTTTQLPEKIKMLLRLCDPYTAGVARPARSHGNSRLTA